MWKCFPGLNSSRDETQRPLIPEVLIPGVMMGCPGFLLRAAQRGSLMYFEQFYLGCLAHASYLLGSEGEAIVVDPQRDVDLYLKTAEEHGLTIRHIFETHLHADFVSGHKELAARTGAKIYFGAQAGVTFQHEAVHRRF
jgi:glyoxylase-like metal-dependent hydrolase (beta-lactamase superfamily II)